MSRVYLISQSQEATDIFNSEFAKFQAGVGYYFEIGFSNWGTIRYSLNGSKVMLEEEESKFLPEHLNRPDVLVLTEEEALAYLLENRSEFEEPQQ